MVLFLELFPFLSWDFPFTAMFIYSRLQSCQFIAWNIHEVVFHSIPVCYIFIFFSIRKYNSNAIIGS